jgi:hypothetical protein
MEETKLESVEKSKKRIRSSRNIISICNSLAAIFIFSIYFQIPDFIFIILSGILLLVNIPIFILFNKIENKIE